MKKTYYVLKGCHYSNFIPCIKRVEERMVFEQMLRFDPSCEYDIDEASCVNKLFGFCFGFGVHKNSVRFGWAYDKKTGFINIYKYVYEDGQLHKHIAHNIETGNYHIYRILAERKGDNMWMIDFIIDGQTVATHWCMYSDACFVTTLGLYFGGNTPAPHTIKINRY